MKKSFIKYVLIGMVAVSSFSCSKKIDEAHLNPNTIVRPTPEQLLPQVISAMAGNYAGHGPMNDIRYFGQYVQNWQFSNTLSPFDRMGYINNVADVAQSVWRSHYYDIGQNNMRLIEWATEEKKWDYAGVGKAIFAWSWMTLTDIYGEVILKEAFNTNQVTFKYDTQPEVYEFVKKLSYEALELLNRTGDKTGKLAEGDAYLFNGDVNKWKKFTYGVLARVHNRYSNKPGFKADSVIHYANLAMQTTAEDALVKFQAVATQVPTNNMFSIARAANLQGSSTGAPSAIRQSAYIANLVNGTNSVVNFTGPVDPRGFYMLRLNANGTFRGLTPNKGQNALPSAERPQNFWGIAQTSNTINNTAPTAEDSVRFIFRRSSPFPVMTASEMKFLKAEAAFRKGDKGTALQAYREGIALHFDMLKTHFNANIPASREIDEAAKQAYLNRVVPTSANALTMSMVMLQKYISLFGWGILETWVDMRRFHYLDTWAGESTQVYADFTPPTGTDLFPDNALSTYANNPQKLAYRYYPRFNSEYVWNINELKRIDATTNYYHTKPIWFAE